MLPSIFLWSWQWWCLLTHFINQNTLSNRYPFNIHFPVFFLNLPHFSFIFSKPLYPKSDYINASYNVLSSYMKWSLPLGIHGLLSETFIHTPLTDAFVFHTEIRSPVFLLQTSTYFLPVASIHFPPSFFVAYIKHIIQFLFLWIIFLLGKLQQQLKVTVLINTWKIY